MRTLTIRLPDDKHYRLKELAQARGISLNKLIEELSTIALAEFDAESRFKAMVAQGNPEKGLKILSKLDSITK
ncbi:toxin-antitoxin system HicB family antitoxin [Gloeocapsa sp. PCC 73106]|uniref:toxin-antitoxin system HicB family antitoxin n=1 Tax=Gloeocapsa sp. PCC 73106 TaxID=102232 RepID=UPI0002AC3B22|nr:toxin-antitoxin system HicB family antitoxin [Gloeocapsa sp. PCC 73106]ELR97027.1 HicB family protein [Gloeocapsa sp. PCC 73106]